MTTHCDHARPARPSQRAMDQALARAEARSVETGRRWTAQRRRALELLLRAGAPVKAYDLLPLLGADGQVVKPATAYRALEFLEALGLVHRIASLNAFVACGHEGPTHVAAFLICECCGIVQEFEPVLDAVTRVAAAERGFEIASLGVEVRGLCGACRADGKRARAGKAEAASA